MEFGAGHFKEITVHSFKKIYTRGKKWVKWC